MSFKASVIKIAIKVAMKWIPKPMVLWVPNMVLKGIAEVMDYNFDLEARTAYAQTQLYGETDTIEVSLQGFAVWRDAEGHKFILRDAQSNKPWLQNILARIVGKTLKIPLIPQLEPHMGLVCELLKPEIPPEEQRPVLEGEAVREEYPALEESLMREALSVEEEHSSQRSD